MPETRTGSWLDDALENWKLRPLGGARLPAGAVERQHRSTPQCHRGKTTLGISLPKLLRVPWPP